MALLSDDEVFGAPQPAAPAVGPAPTGGLLSDEEVFAQPAAASVPSAPKLLSDDEVFGKPAAPAPGTEGFLGGLKRGFLSTTFKQNPDLAANALEATGNLVPEGVKPTVMAGRDIARGLESSDPAHQPSQLRLRDVIEGGGKNALEWAGNTLGAGIASTIPSAITGAGGAILGSQVAPGIGTVVGGTLGSTLSGYPMALGEVYSELKKHGVDEERAAKVSAIAAIPMAALDAIPAAWALTKFGGLDVIKREAGRILAQRLVQEGAKGATLEGLTEATQETIGKIAQHVEAGVPFWTKDNGWGILESGAAGVLTGGALGSMSGVARDNVATPPATPDAIQSAFTDFSSAKKGASPAQGQETTLPTQEPGLPSGRAPEVAATGTSPAPVEAVSAPPSLSRTDEPPAPIFYSQAAKVASEKLPDQFSGDQLLGTLRNAGVKEEEMQWLEIPEYVSEREGKVSKKDLLEHLEEKAIQIEDVQYGSGSAFNTTLQEVEPTAIVDNNGEFVEKEWTIPEAPGWIIQKTGGTNAIGEPALPTFDIYDPNGKLYSYGTTLEEAQGKLNRHLSPPDQTTFGGWQSLKGGENYREHLLRMELPDLVQDGDQADYVGPHWDPTNVLAHYRTSQFSDVEGKRGLAVQEIQSDWHQQGRKHGYRTTASEPHPFPVQERRVPDAPFKSNWAELAIKRILRQAADEGHERVYFASGAANADLYRQQGAERAGQIEFYDKIVPRIVEKWARKLGGKTGKTEIVTGYWVRGTGMDSFGQPLEPYGRDGGGAQAKPFETLQDAQTEALRWEGNAEIIPDRTTVFYVDITPQMSSNVQRGLPMFSQHYTLPQILNGSTKTGFVVPADDTMFKFDKTGTLDFSPIVEATAKIANDVAKRLGMKAPVFVRIGAKFEEPDAGGFYNNWFDKRTKEPMAHVITVIPNQLTTEADVYALVAHELGHAIEAEMFRKADAMTHLLVMEEYYKYRQKLADEGVTTMGGLFSRRDNFIMQQMRDKRILGVELQSLPEDNRKYWLSFEEWFAENVARWMTTDEKALNAVERLFKSIARALRQLYEEFQRKTGWAAAPNELVKGYLESLEWQQANLAAIAEQKRKEGEAKNARAMRAAGFPEHPYSEQTATTIGGREIIADLARSAKLSGPGLAQANATAAMADHYSKWYKWGLSVIQLAERNPHIQSLFRYKELWQNKTLERQQIMDGKLDVIKRWRTLSKEQAEGLSGLIDDYMNMVYLTPQEVAAKVTREPTPAEQAQLVAKHKLGNEAVAIFGQIRADFKDMLGRYRDILNAEAMKISDAYRRAEKLRAIQAQFDALDKQPYFPAMRFGDLTLEVKDANGDLVEFHLFESKRNRGKAVEQLTSQYPASAGYSIKVGKLPEDAGPLMGLPPAFLDLIEQKLGLSQSQQGALELLRFQMAPAQSFKHRFERKNRTPGYSMDFMRAYANYFFHGSNHLTRVKYMDDMRQVVKDLRDESRQMVDGTKRMEIANFVGEHLDYMLNPKSDWSTLRALTFLWALGFSPAAALLNTTQIFIGSYPILAAGFGDVKSIAALTKAGARLSTYYKKGSFALAPGFEMKAIAEAVKEGVISEAMAPELAAVSEGNNLQGSVGGYVHQRYIKTMEWAGKMFEMTEQWNRRVTFRAALDLALENPRAKYVDDAVAKNGLQYDRLRAAGWTEREARAFVTAKYAVESTQYIYGQYAQPKLMRGKLRTVFIFKSFIQNTLFMLWNNPAAAARSLIVMAALGGLMGLPGMEDLKGLIKLVAKKLGFDFDPDDEARRFAVDVLGGKVPPDLLLHGLSRYGMGMPVVLQQLGIPAPVMDMSRSVSMGNILPIQLDAAFGGGIRPERGMLDSVQRASGATFGVGFNIWKALNDSQLDVDSLARWTKAMPREAQALARTWKAFSEGAIKNRQGNAVVRFDPHDPVQMMEVLAMAGGWQPLRLTAQWDRIIAEREAIEYWDLRRNGLLRQYFEALRSGNDSDRERMISSIQQFNAKLPDAAKAKAITGDTLRRSVATRGRLQSLQEQGLPAQKSNVGIVQEIQRLHPEAQVDVRPVR